MEKLNKTIIEYSDQDRLHCIPHCQKYGKHDTCSIYYPTEASSYGEVVAMEKNCKKEKMIGLGGAPIRASILPNDPKSRKNFPVVSGFLDYFPDAVVAISEVSKVGNDQHNPGQSLRWTRGKSGDESDTCIRHFLQRGTLDTDGLRHTAKAAWRMLAVLQKEIENEGDKK